MLTLTKSEFHLEAKPKLYQGFLKKVWSILVPLDQIFNLERSFMVITMNFNNH